MLRPLCLTGYAKSLLALGALLYVAGVASAASYLDKESRSPETPTSAQEVVVTAISDTIPGEDVWLEYHLLGTGSWIQVKCDAIAYDSEIQRTTWRGRIPAFRDGAQVEYQFFVKYPDGGNWNFTGFGLPYTVSTSPNISVGSPVHSSPTAYNGNVYFGADDGKLYGYSLAGMTALAGFPFDATAEAGAGAKVLGRPALRAIGGTIYLFFLTDNGYIFRLHLNGDGSLDTVTDPPRHYRPDPSASNVSTTPAVFAVGGTEYIFAAINTASGAKLFKVPADAMDSNAAIPFGTGTSVTSSPAGGAGLDVYLGIVGSAASGFVRVNASTFDVRAELAGGEAVSGSPFISGTNEFTLQVPTMYLGTNSGNIYAVNATTGATLEPFGSNGKVTVAAGQPLTSIFLFKKMLYTTGATDGMVYKVNAENGNVEDAYNVTAETGGKVPAGLAVDPKDNGYLLWGTDNGRFYQVDASNWNNKRIHTLATDASAFLTAPATDIVSGHVMAGNVDGKLYIYPR